MRAGTFRSLIALLTTVILAAGCGTASPSLTPATPASAPGTTPSPEVRDTPAWVQTYVVAPGDTPALVAQKFGISDGALQVANPALAGATQLEVGQTLGVPLDGPTLVLEAAGGDGVFRTGHLRARVGEQVVFRIIGDPEWAGDGVDLLDRTGSGAWNSFDSATLDIWGRATAASRTGEGSSRFVWQAVMVGSGEPVLRSSLLLVEWGDPGPCAVSIHAGDTEITAPDGAVYTLALGTDGESRGQLTIVAAGVEGSTETGWRVVLPPCWEPMSYAVAGDGTVHLSVSTGFGDPLAETWLVTFGPDGLRAMRSVPGLEWFVTAPDGTVYAGARDMDWAGHGSGSMYTVLRSRLIALDANGAPRPGWPYETGGVASEPAFAPDGTPYLAVGEGPDAPGQIVALGPDGSPKPGWPYRVPGTLEWYECGSECYDYPRAPAIASDGSVFDSFGSGIYLVRADGRPAPGWPYLLPEGTHGIDCCLGDTPGPLPNYRPLLTADGRIYLPRRDERYETEHVDLMCLLPDGTICDGWPVRFADGLENNCHYEDEDGTYHDGFWASEDGTMSVCLHDPGDCSEQVVSIRPDGTIID